MTAKIFKPQRHILTNSSRRLARATAMGLLMLAMAAPLCEAFAQSAPVMFGYRDFYFGKTANSTPTGEKPESKLWWNDGIWWGSLWDPVLRQHTIHRFEVAAQSWTSTGTVIDDRPNAKADALWDGQHLYLVSKIFTHTPGPTEPLNGGRLYRYRYEATAQRYNLDAGFPVMVNGSTSETLVLTKDSAGKLWVTWTEGGKVKVNHSLNNDLTWGAPFDLPVQGTDIKIDDISSIVAFGGNKIGILWSNQNDRISYFAVHRDGNADEMWEPKEVALADPALGSVSYDHINLKPACDNDGNLYAVAKTNLTKSGMPHVYMLKRDAAGVWTRHVVSTADDGHDRPILLIDGEHRKAYVFAMSAGAIYMKSTNLNPIAFAAGIGKPFIQSATDSLISNPTSTKQCLNSATGLLVLASDQYRRAYFHNYLDLDQSPKHFKLRINTIGSGHVAQNPASSDYAAGTTVTLTAIPQSGTEGVQFYGWSGDLSDTDNPVTIMMDGNKNITAVFITTDSSRGVINQETQIGGASNSLTVKTVKHIAGVAGELYLAAIATKPKAGVTRVSGLGLNWAPVKAQCAGRNTTGLEVWMAQGVPSGNDTVTATLASAAFNSAIAVTRYSGVDPLNPINHVIAGNTNGENGACSGGVDNRNYSLNLPTTPQGGTMIYCATTMRNVSHSPGAEFTERAELMQGSEGSAASLAVADRRLASPGMAAVTGSFSGDVDWAAVAVAIKPLLTTNVGDGPPTVFQLEQNDPNPFIGSTSIGFALPVACNVLLEVYDANDRLVRTLVTGEMELGRYSAQWDGTDQFNQPLAAGTYSYKLNVENEDGLHLFAQTRQMRLLPAEFQLEQNYPNPFSINAAGDNPSTQIRFVLPQPSHVTIKMYTISGAEIRTLADKTYPAGVHTVAFQADNLPSGVYFYMMQAGGVRQSGRLMLVK